MKKVITNVMHNQKVAIERLLFLLGIKYSIENINYDWSNIYLEESNKKKIKIVSDYIEKMKKEEIMEEVVDKFLINIKKI